MKDKSLRQFKNSQQRREFLEKKLGVSLNPIGTFSFREEDVLGKNIENLIGSTQVPIGVAGPISILGLEPKNYYIPLATTEGALVASISRGCKAITHCGGAQVEIEEVGITRGPVFSTTGIKKSLTLASWVASHFSLIKKITEQTSSHLKLLKIEPSIAGRNVFLRFYFNTADAMGMNMATFATSEAVNLIERKTGSVCVSIAGNFDTDKKPSLLNFISGRGRRVHAEVILSKKVLKQILKVDSKQLAEVVYRKCQIGSAMSGSLGFNAHYANIVAAIFIACGQDPAHIVEGSLGVTTAEALPHGSLYFSIYLPALIVGSVGGGTSLPTQREALQIMSSFGQGQSERLAKVIGAAVLAGELSLLSSQTEGSLALSHLRLGRNKKE